MQVLSFMKLKRTVKMSTSDKCMNNEMLFDSKKERSTDTCNVDDLEIVYWLKEASHKYLYCMILFVCNAQNRHGYRNRNISCCQVLGRSGRGD